MEIKNSLLDIEDIKKSRIPLLNLFIRKTAVITSTQEDLVELIIKDQWENANKMTKDDSDIAELNFPNIGTFSISKRKSINRIKTLDSYNETCNKTLENENSTETEIKRANTILAKNERLIKSILHKNKKKSLDEF